MRYPTSDIARRILDLVDMRVIRSHGGGPYMDQKDYVTFYLSRREGGWAHMCKVSYSEADDVFTVEHWRTRGGAVETLSRQEGVLYDTLDYAVRVALAR